MQLIANINNQFELKRNFDVLVLFEFVTDYLKQ